MSRRSVSSPNVRPGSRTSPRPASASKTMLNDHYIHRIATNRSAVLGSFYDARTECLLQKLALGKTPITKTSQNKVIDCIIMKEDTFDNEDLFRKIGIHDEPWLNSILNIIPSDGIASVVHYSFPKRTSTRFLYYYYSSEEQSISSNESTVRMNIPKVIPDIRATHVISVMKLGIQALIELQLPPSDEKNLDSLLEKIAQQLITNKFALSISRDEKLLLDRITITKIFSNIPDLYNISTLADICQEITAIKPHIYRQHPLEYTLRTIKWFYPSYPTEKARYVSLEPETVKIIKQYLLSLSSKITKLKTSSNTEDKQTLEERLKEQYDAVRQQIATTEEMYKAEIERICDLVLTIRSGTIRQELITEMLINTSEKSLQSSIDLIAKRLQSLREKEKLINNFDQQDIKYLNIKQYFMEKSDDLKVIFKTLCKKGKPKCIFCSTDDLRNQNSSTWNDQYSKWMQERETNSSLTLVYADFTYASFHLSEAKILSTKSTGDSKTQSESSSIPASSSPETVQSSSKQPLKIEKPISPPTKESLSGTQTSQVTPETNEQSKEIEESSHSSITSQQTSIPIPRKRKQPTGAENLSSLSEPAKTSTAENVVPSNEQINHVGELCNGSKLPITSAPQVKTRAKHRDSDLSGPIMPTIPLKSSTAKQTSISEKRPNCPNEHGNGSELSPTPSASKTAQSTNEQPGKIKQTVRPSTAPNLSNTGEISSQETQPNKTNEQQKRLSSSTRSISDISVVLNQENEDYKEASNSSISSKQSDTENTSPRREQPVSLEDSTNLSRSSTPSTPLPTPRERRRSGKTGNLLNSTESSNSPIAESTTLSNEKINKEGELSNISHLPKILTPQAVPRTKKEFTNNEEPTKCADEQVISSKSPDTAQPSENQSEDIEEQSHQLKSPRSLHTEHPSPSKQQSNDVEKQSDTQRSPIPATPEVPTGKGDRINSPRSTTVKYNNILLLGESGVGKSTFINALVNYHAFETLEQARSNEPLVVMPVSFLMTVGDNFDEKIVRFGGVDPNEDHNHPGQSVTQHCRSYVFPIGTRTKLRIIDTPGMGDTRGLEQDDRNMQHILSFINNLSHLNAICILLKPNESRLNIAVRSYFSRLLNFLGENARNNIVFCFTNTRATFFSPGNTGPLLSKMIGELPIKDIPFKKSNTFCFDNESFRYLIALQNGIDFDAYQQNEYQQCWTNSATVANRLLEYICGELKPYSQYQWQSIEHVQFKIAQLIRPMLETMRNLFRNITLLKEKSSKLLIKLCPTILSQPSAICYKCQRTPKRFRDFWILPDDLHTFSEKCNCCDCSRKRHIDIDYKLEYELTQYEGTQSFDKMTSDLNQLRMAVLEFAQFYAYVIDTLQQSDPMLVALKRIIAEEKQICLQKDSDCFNSTLYNIFMNLKEQYIERRTTTISVNVPVDLPSLYEQINDINKIDEISEQVHAIKQAQKRYMKQHEKQVS